MVSQSQALKDLVTRQHTIGGLGAEPPAAGGHGRERVFLAGVRFCE